MLIMESINNNKISNRRGSIYIYLKNLVLLPAAAMPVYNFQKNPQTNVCAFPGGGRLIPNGESF